MTAAIGALIGARRVATVAGVAWAATTGSFAWRRIAPGPGEVAEIAAMAVTSAAIPPVAVAHRLRGELCCRRAPAAPVRGVEAVLFDRDGTLVHDVAYNGDPGRVDVVDGARAALDRLRAAGLPIGLVTNQSGVARGLISADDVDRVNAYLEQVLGSFDAMAVCLHGPDDGCRCRKPGPGLIVEVAARLGVDPTGCVVIGDIGADVDAATAAGARGILVPTAVTRRGDIANAVDVAADLETAVDMVLGTS
jgi:histidinol-phosphate phosphatase family protein